MPKLASFALLALLTAALTACRSTPPRSEAYAESERTRAAGGGPPAQLRAQWEAAAHVLDRRCVVCHGCYDAPCQLKLGSFEGLVRGATKKPVYDGARLVAVDPTRLFVDAHTIGAWRDKGFHKILPERVNEDAKKSLLWRMLELKREHPLPPTARLNEEEFDLSLNRDQVCATEEDFEDFADEHPTWGMPYALPGITQEEQNALGAWLEAGTPHVHEPELNARHLSSIRSWEQFLNEPSLKTQLFARYIYEHLFLASLYFGDVDEHTFFRLVCSRTPPGKTVEEIPTRRPFDDPEVKQVYYRLVRRVGQPLIKTHMPYALSPMRLTRFRQLFVEPDYEVTRLPSYSPKVSANPFKAFHELPVRSRYRFMLEEAEFTMMGFIKGPVCRGQIALNVIEDRFWVSFVDPDVSWLEAEAHFLEQVDEDLDLPARGGSTNAGLFLWYRLAKKQRRFLKAKSAFLDGLAAKNVPVALSAIWDGDGNNANAALTVLRHHDSATVTKGFVGGPSETSWVVGYSLLERIHYLLVAGFDVFGNVGHQLTTRLYMDFLRMEGEYNYLLLLPPQRRKELVDRWYRNVDKDVKDEVYGQTASFAHPPDIQYQTDTPELELAAMLEAHTEQARARHHELSRIEAAGIRAELARLDALIGPSVQQFPEISFVAVELGGRVEHVTLLRDTSYTNVAQLFEEDKRRVPDEDRLTVVRGFLGAYPNALFVVAQEELSAFVAQVEAMRGESDYMRLRERFGVLRTHPAFWSHSDRMHDDAHALDPLRAGLFDFNRLDPY